MIQNYIVSLLKNISLFVWEKIVSMLLIFNLCLDPETSFNNINEWKNMVYTIIRFLLTFQKYL